MNVARFIARRYAKSKSTWNVIHLITKISVVGITISTASLVILLSAFNGIEQIVIKLYSDFDSSITIQSAKSKTFDQGFLDYAQLQSVPGVSNISRAIEEVVILQRQDKWVHAHMIGVDTNFLSMSKMKDHILEGQAILYKEGKPQAIFGATLLNKLDGYIPQADIAQEQILFNAPLRDSKISNRRNPLSTKMVGVVARMNYNREVNEDIVLVPYSLANELLDYGEDITAIYVAVDQEYKLTKVKEQIQKIVGSDFEVKTNYEKNELIFKTSKSERLIVFFILVFIFILASFNLIASITMLFLEKKEDILTLINIGASKKLIFNIFFYEGLFIVRRGVVWGLLIGYLIVLIQTTFGLIEMPNVPGEHFPMLATWSDAISIIISVAFLGFIVSYFPTRILIGRHKRLKDI